VVAILARSWLSLHCLGPAELWPHRAVVGVVHPPEGQAILLSSLYLRDSEGLSEANLDILGALGAHFSTSGMPFLMGGDFNLEPPTPHESEFVRNLKGQLVAADGPTWCGTGVPKCFDFFVLSGGLAKAVSSVSKNFDGGTFHPHLPVRIQFHVVIANLHVLSFRKPPRSLWMPRSVLRPSPRVTVNARPFWTRP
jgi:hypothetical protein